MKSIIRKIKGGLIVSCQALEDEPLHGAIIMKKMAQAALEGGAIGIRANSPLDIIEMKKEISVPIIGLHKQFYNDSEVYITPTMKEVEEIVNAGADIIAIDATLRNRPYNQTLKDFVQEIMKMFPKIILMGDVSTLDEGIQAEKLGIHLISTTLAGYTPYTNHIKEFDKELLISLIHNVDIPVIAEGRVNSPKLAAECLQLGAHAVVVGSAITRPQEITKTYVESIENSGMFGAAFLSRSHL